MPAIIHLLRGPARSGKTNTLLERFQSAERDVPNSALWISPNRRCVLGLRESSPEAFIRRPLTFEEFAGEIIRANDPAALPLANVHRRLVIEELLGKLHGDGKLTYFERVIDTRGFPSGVIDFIAELRRHGIEPDDAEGTLCTNKGEQTGRIREIVECLAIYRAYLERVVSLNLHDLEGRYHYARELLVRGERRPFEKVQIAIFDGFTSFTDVQHELLMAFTESLSEVWIALTDEANTARAELFSETRDSAMRLRRHPIVEHWSSAVRSLIAPAGIAHLEQQLFRSLRSVDRSSNADGIRLLKAPGLLGETRMVARAIKKLHVAGVQAGEILVTMRDVEPYADLVREVFDEYGIPVDVEGVDPIIRNPAVSTLLRAIGVPAGRWSFAGVTAILRSTYFRPDWPEVHACPDVAQKAEALLRSLGITRGRASFLKSVDYWEDNGPKVVEDEHGEAKRRRRKHDLAVLCRPFLQRFFRAWDILPTKVTLAEHVDAARRFATDLGLEAAALQTPADAAALARLWRDLAQWVKLSEMLHEPEWTTESRKFLQVLSALASESGISRTPRGPGRVRVLSAPIASTLNAAHVFVMGLGERSFPKLAAPEPFLDESQRQSFRKRGHQWASMGDLLASEMLLFYHLLTRADRELVLSYPAVDEKGQKLLPCSFLQSVLSCFKDGAVSTTEQRMLLDGYGSEAPYSLAEFRVRTARRGLTNCGRLPADVTANLHAARDVAKARFKDKNFGAYDGLLASKSSLAELGHVVGPQNVFSPTALEEYIACPFRFFLSRVLTIEPLDEPTDEIEVTKRGQAIHDAMSGMHRQLHCNGEYAPNETLDGILREHLHRAIEDYADSNNPAVEVLWRLEGQRLQKWADRYRAQWQRFTEPWVELNMMPRPEFFEKGFGMPPRGDDSMMDPLVIESEGVEVRVRGQIDRVDVVETEDASGFWIIDYKTGRSENHKAKSVQELLRVQLALYALAVEKLLAARRARPFGLAYWFLGEDGPKVALPGRASTAWFEDEESWPNFRGRLEKWITQLVSNMRAGIFSLKPRSDDCTNTCPYGQVCRITQSRRVDKNWQLPTPPE